MTLGDQIAAQRRRMGISQTELARQLGTVPQRVSNLERCDNVNLDTAIKLADVFGITLDELAGRDAASTCAERARRERILAEIESLRSQL